MPRSLPKMVTPTLSVRIHIACQLGGSTERERAGIGGSGLGAGLTGFQVQAHAADSRSELNHLLGCIRKVCVQLRGLWTVYPHAGPGLEARLVPRG